ncbi:MAG: hypothetical protein WCT02_02320 [Candidatus Paceibacterota bacterium]
MKQDLGVVVESFLCKEQGCGTRITFEPAKAEHLSIGSLEGLVAECRTCGRLYWPQTTAAVVSEAFEKVYKSRYGRLVYVPLSRTERNLTVTALVNASASAPPEHIEYYRRELTRFVGIGHLPGCSPDQGQCTCGVFIAKNWLAAHPQDVDAP